MAEILSNNQIKTIAYYLPQYHSIPENDKAWGKGFTEWTNTKKAKPLFDGHYQPKTPLNHNYYDLRDVEVMVRQANLAKQYGVFGFCYYHYWFKNGKKLLERPIEQMLTEKRVDIPFCLSWANENWSKRWDGGNQEIIVEQDYGDETDWEVHLAYLIPFFKDERYITVDGKPVFLIYRPEIIPNIENMLLYWQSKAKKYGFKGFCFMIQNSGLYFSPAFDLGQFEYQIKFPPFFATIYRDKNIGKLKKQQKIYKLLKEFGLAGITNFALKVIKQKKDGNRAKSEQTPTKLSYDETWESLLGSESHDYLVEGAFVDWDNTARKENGYVHVGATPTKFKNYMLKLICKINSNRLLPAIFINAWNEWAEGAYLEPDDKNGYLYLEALKEALSEGNAVER